MLTPTDSVELSVSRLDLDQIEEQYRAPAGYEWLVQITEAERLRRTGEQEGRDLLLEEFERNYFGVEVGGMRRYFEERMIRWIPPGCVLADYGCGGPWWKDAYWGIPKQVIGIEVDPGSLVRIRTAFPDHNRYRLVYARTGLTTLPDGIADIVLSSGVVGFILPSQAELHVVEAARLLKPGGRAVFSRVNAVNYGTLYRLSKLTESGRGGFAYQYTTSELRRLIESRGLRILLAERLGFYWPWPWPVRQKLYAYALFRTLDRLMNRLVPGMAVHHLVVAEKPL